MSKKGNDVPAAPDYSGLMKASQAQIDKSNELQQEQFDWAKQAYADNKATSDKVAASAIALQDQEAAASKQAQDRYTNTAIPLQDAYIEDANTYDSPARRDLAMGQAQGAVAASFDAARQNAQRDLESYGINPSATRFAALDIGTRTQQAAAEAAAGTTASLNTQATARQMRENAINMTSGLPAQANAAAAGANSAGSSAVNAGSTTTSTGASTMGTAPQYGALADSALGQSVTATGQSYADQMKQYQANYDANTAWMAPLSAVAGVATGALLKKAAGGAIPATASPSRGAIPDDVPAALTAGEFVVPADTVRWLGEKAMHQMIAKAANDRAAAQQQPQRASAIPTR